jgi:pimeloyl-ACP methyl ester carboxylesterase
MATYGPATAPAPQIEPSRRRPGISRRMIYLLVWITVLGLGGWGLRLAADRYLRAMSVLLRLQNPNAQGFATSFARHAVTEQEGSAETPHGTVKFRLYLPQGVSHPGGIILLHGIHRAGIEEPRLINFARTMAGAGVEVMTPELEDLADYKVTPRTVDVIGDSAVLLANKMGLPKVGVLGLSFAGGLALLAANKSEFADKIGFVAAVGAHDDMPRVARFFAANMIEKPDGSAVALKAHEYGVLVLAYSHIEDFFSPRDASVAREALRQWLWEQPSDSMQTAQGLSPAGRQEFDTILHHRELLQPALVLEIQRHSDEMQAVSPHGQVSTLHVPVYLLHGTTDTVIPASETMWLAKDVPPQDLKVVLISPAMNMIHVDGQQPVTTFERVALVDFMAQVLRAADRLGSAGRR